jgi:DDE superfamily endonuclease
LEKVKSQHAVLVKIGQFLIVVNAKPGWTNLPTYQKWFDTVFLPEVQKHTVSPVLLLLDNAPRHFNGLQKDGIQVEFFPPNCTSWKQPCDQGIINALKARYKFLCLRDVLRFYDLSEHKKESLQTLGTHIRRGSAGVEYGNPAHLMDAAKFIKEAWDSVLPISIENCFRKADISIQYFDDIESYEETSIEEQIVKLIDGISDLNINDITEFIHVDDPTSKEFTEAIMDNVNDVVDMINNNHCLEEELEDEVERKDDIIDLPDNAATICKFEEVFAKIAAIGTEILHPSLVSKTHEQHGDLIAAYKT